MDSTFHALGQILLNGLPTFFLILFLNFYLKRVFFGPLEQTLAKRYEVTEGARLAADDALRNADVRISEYQAALRAARGELYADQNAAHKKMQDEQSAAIGAARAKAEQFLLRNKADLAAQKQSAFESLAGKSDDLADRIANSILAPRKAA